MGRMGGFLGARRALAPSPNPTLPADGVKEAGHLKMVAGLRNPGLRSYPKRPAFPRGPANPRWTTQSHPQPALSGEPCDHLSELE